jgi:hypothetical protein
MAHEPGDTAMRARRLAVTAALSVATVLVGLAAPASAAPPGKERFVFVFTFPTSNFTGVAAATGLENGVGIVQAVPGDPAHGTVSLPQGKLFFVVKTRFNVDDVDRRSCVDRVTGADNLQVTGGTGVFTEATGRGTDTERAVLVFPRNHGSCNFRASPIAGIDVVYANLNLMLQEHGNTAAKSPGLGVW